MAIRAPEFKGPDNKFRTQYIFTTTSPLRFFEGRMDPSTVDMQVSLQGAPFSSDPDFIAFEGQTFIVPNPSAFPDGLPLLPGANTIRVLSVQTDGSSSAISSIQAHLSLDSDLGSSIIPPGGISLERFEGTVKVALEGAGDPAITGYHFYAATSPGGGLEGFSRINPRLVTTGKVQEALVDLASLSVDARVSANLDGSKTADPLFLIVKGTQQDRFGATHQVDFNESLEVPDTATQLRTTLTVQSVLAQVQFSFVHDRLSTFLSSENPAIPNAAFASISREDPLYYVASAVYLIDEVEVESAFSAEVQGSPLIIAPALGRFPQVSKAQMDRDIVLSITRSQPQISTVPGSTVRDTFIDPFTTEAERARFILDFLHNAATFQTLLQIDDPGLTGSSIPVSQSPYKLALKQAFFLSGTTAVQTLIDNAFDKLAANYGKVRRTGRRSRGQVTFFTDRRPTTSLSFPIGTVVEGGGVRFRTTSNAEISAAGSGQFFNPSTGRFSVQAFIQAEIPGLEGDLARGQITTYRGSVPKISVLNASATFGGAPLETNRELAVRCLRAFASVDSGRLQGYVDTAQDVSGALQVNVVDAGHPLMLRDYDAASGRHLGGKVDVWIKGQSAAIQTDLFAFSFEIKRKVQFEPFGDPQALKFRAVDKGLSASNPIIEMLDIPDMGFEMRNASQGYVYNLTGVVIIGPDQIQLDTSLNDPTRTHLADVVLGDYRYRTGDRHTFVNQPVDAIRSLKGDPTRSGTISPVVYTLVRATSPLELGRSTEAGDSLQVTEPLQDNGDTIPSGVPIQVTGEAHVILEGTEYLFNLGASPPTVRIFNADRTTEFKGPFVPEGVAQDFTLVGGGSSSVPLGVNLTVGSQIVQGSRVIIDYKHDENFTVEYEVNGLIQAAQDALDKKRHITADVLAKAAVEVPVDIFGTVVLRRQSSVASVRARIRTNLSNLFNSLVLGEPIRQSDVINVLEGTEGVSYVVVPLDHMTKGDGALVTREGLQGDLASDFTAVTSWSTPNVKVWLMEQPLTAATTHGGGPVNEFRGVFKDLVKMRHLDSPPNNNGVPLRNLSGQAFIIGNVGLNIPGVSDDATLAQRFPFATAAELDTQRILLTANRVLISLPVDDVPEDFEYTVTYVVRGDAGVKNIEPGPIEFLTLGAIDFAMDEDKDFKARVTGRD